MLPTIALVRLGVAAAVALLLSLHGRRKKSLSPSGARAAFVVGFLSFALSYRCGLTMIAFYYSSSKLTKYRAVDKQKLEAHFDQESERGAKQVLSCSVVGVLLAIAFAVHHHQHATSTAIITGSGVNDAPLSFSTDAVSAFLSAAYLGHYACCAGDTWASELGILDSFGSPRLALTPWRSVPRGTNGGMSVTGTAASAAGGAFVGLSYALLGWLFVGSEALQLAPLLLLGGFGGLAGSYLDSAIGQLLQASYLDSETGCVVGQPGRGRTHICGVALLSNTQVGGHSIRWMADRI
jgi:uncharacterized membrane protein